MLYRDPPITKIHFIIFFILATILLFWNVWLPELSNTEAFIAVSARECSSNPLLQEITYHGIPHTLFPVYIRFLACCEWLFEGSLQYETVVRLPSILSALGILVVFFLYAKKRLTKTGTLTTISLIGSAFIFHKMSSYGNEEIIFTFFISIAWLAFHYISFFRKQHWWHFWIIGSIAIFLAYITIGWPTFFLFYAPLFIQRSYYRIFSCLGSKQHIICALLVGIAIFFMPSTSQHNKEIIESITFDQSTTSFIKHWLEFPLKSLIYALPIIPFIWIGFCSWFRTMDTKPRFNSYFSRLCVVVLIIIWFFPYFSSRHIIFIVPLLSILTANNAHILIQRGSKFFSWFINLLYKTSFITSFIAVLLTTSITYNWIKLVDFNVSKFYLISLFTIFLFLINVIIIIIGNKIPYFLRVFIFTSICYLSWQSTITPIKAWLNNDHRYNGLEVLTGKTSNSTTKLPEDAIILREMKTCKNLPGESYYLNKKIIATDNIENKLEEMFNNKESVFVLTGGSKPDISEANFGKYTWIAISNECIIENRSMLNAEIMKVHKEGSIMTLARNKVETETETNKTNTIKARLYLGTKKEIKNNPNTASENEN